VVLDIREVLARHPVFARFRNEALDAVLQATTQSRVRKGDPLWRAGERATHFTLAAEGLVAVFVPTGTAKEMFLGIASPGDGVGEAATLLGEVHRDNAVGFEAATAVLRVPRGLVIELLEQNGAASIAYAQRLAALRRAADRRVASLTLSSEARIAEIVLALAARFGTVVEGELVEVSLRITRAQIAQMVGSTVETVIRTLSKWTRDGLLAPNEARIVVRDRVALARIAGVSPDAVDGLASLTRIS
jgi:CRP/FNR family transcriptional regulator